MRKAWTSRRTGRSLGATKVEAMARRRSQLVLPLALAAGALAGIGGSLGRAAPVVSAKQPRSAYLHVAPTRCGFGSRAGARNLHGLATRPLARQVAATIRAVREIRRLTPKQPLRPTLLTPAELRQRLRRDYAAPTDERAELRRRALELLGAIPRGFDLPRATNESLATGIVGFYEPATKSLVVVRPDGSVRLGTDALVTVAHESEHALVDQFFGFPRGRSDDGWGDTWRAASALAEGSATITEWRFVEALRGRAAVSALLAEEVGPDIFQASAALPPFFDQEFAFAHLEGIGFVCELYARGGWKAVNAAYRRPPSTSAQILFPQRYVRRDRGRPAPPLADLPEPWRRTVTGTFGAADLLWLFRAPGGSYRRGLSVPLARAAVWNGGAIEIWTRDGGDVAAAVGLTARTARASLCGSMRAWYRAAFPGAVVTARPAATTFAGGGQAAALTCRGTAVRLGIAASAEIADALARPAPAGSRR